MQWYSVIGLTFNILIFFGNLYMLQSPDGLAVASVGDETLRIWNVFGSPDEVKSSKETSAPEPFAHVSRIR